MLLESLGDGASIRHGVRQSWPGSVLIAIDADHKGRAGTIETHLAGIRRIGCIARLKCNGNPSIDRATRSGTQKNGNRNKGCNRSSAPHTPPPSIIRPGQKRRETRSRVKRRPSMAPLYASFVRLFQSRILPLAHCHRFRRSHSLFREVLSCTSCCTRKPRPN